MIFSNYIFFHFSGSRLLALGHLLADTEFLTGPEFTEQMVRYRKKYLISVNLEKMIQ